MDGRIGRAAWEAVAAEIRAHRRNGLGRLLTEDIVRFTSALALVDRGIDPATLHVEWPHPTLKNSRIDLVADGHPPVLIEFKFPREPNEQNAAWTMAWGEVLKDFYRLAVFPGEAERLFVYVETARLRRYMAGAARRYGMIIDIDQVVLDPADAARLPTTASQIIGTELAAHHVRARRISLLDIDDGLRMAVYEVDPLGVPPDPAIERLVAEGTPGDPMSIVVQTDGEASQRVADKVDDLPSVAVPAGTRGGARQEILAAIRALLARSGHDTFSPAEVLSEMKRRGSGYADTTIRTMITGHMCRNAPDNAGTTYDDLERIEYGVYRLLHHGQAHDRPPR